MLGVLSPGEADHLRQCQMHGVHLLYYHLKLMGVLVHQAILVVAPHLGEVAHDHLLLVVIDPMSLHLMRGVQIHVHHLHQDYQQQIRHLLLQLALEVQKQDQETLNCLALQKIQQIVQLHGGPLELLREWYYPGS